MSTAVEFYWHVHDDVLIEPLTEPVEHRIAYIKNCKPPHEVETRLRLLRRADLSSLPALAEAWRAYAEAWRAYAEARRANQPQLEVLHREQCPDCPWNGSTILPAEAQS